MLANSDALRRAGRCRVDLLLRFHFPKLEKKRISSPPRAEIAKERYWSVVCAASIDQCAHLRVIKASLLRGSIRLAGALAGVGQWNARTMVKLTRAATARGGIELPTRKTGERNQWD